MDFIQEIVNQFDLKIKYVSSFTNARSWENENIILDDNGWGVVTVHEKKDLQSKFIIKSKSKNIKEYLTKVIKLISCK